MQLHERPGEQSSISQKPFWERRGEWPQMAKTFDNGPMKILDLILNIQWNYPIIDTYFGHYGRDFIMKIPLGHSAQPDSIIWYYEKSRTYSVRSGYCIALQYNMINDPSTVDASSVWWRVDHNVSLVLKVNELELFVMVLWALWFSRNNGLFNNKWLTPGEILDIAGNTYEAYQSCERISNSGKPIAPANTRSKWSAPLGMDLKLNVDVAVIFGQDSIGVVAVIRDSDVEAIALREGLEFADSRGIAISSVETDCEALAKICDASTKELEDETCFVIADIRRLLSQVRECNRVVHSLASSAIVGSNFSVWNLRCTYLVKGKGNEVFMIGSFEAFWPGSWQPVERLEISDGAITTHVVDNEDVVQVDIPMSHLRVRSRKATWSDCASFLRPGIDVCVLSTTHTSENDDDETNAEPVWLDARIRSIERKTHNDACACQFYVSFYINQGPDLFSENKKLSKETTTIKIDKISILQNFESKPCETQYYRWSSTEDCFSVHNFKFFHGKFSADLTWLLIASVQKKTAFDVKSIQNRIVYEISENNSHIGRANPRDQSYAVNFKVNNETLTPVVVQFVPSALDERSDRHDEFGSFSSYNLTELRRSKRRHVQPDRFLACDNLPDYEIEVTRLGEGKTYKTEHDKIELEYDDEYDEMPLPLSIQADNKYHQNGGAEKWSTSYERKSNENFQLSSDHASGEQFLNFKIPKNEPKDTDDMVSEYFYMNGSSSSHKRTTFDPNFIDLESGSNRGGKGSRRNYDGKSSCSTSLKRDCYYVRESIYDVKSYKKGSLSAQLCREMIRKCMINIEDTLKKKPDRLPVVDQWKELQSTKNSDKRDKDEKPSTENEEEMSEIDLLWKEMELALASWYLLDDDEDHVEPTADMQKSSKKSENVCKHDYILNEQVGTVCRLCGFVETEIKDILPPFVSSAHWASNKEERTEDDSDHKTSQDGDLDQFHIPDPSSTPSIEVERENDVWNLIPDLGNKLRSHQKKAFEFLWRNIAGSLVPSQMEKNKKERGGCVISHTPGAGKTLLIISFLVSYLKLFPGSRPLVLAPKTTLYTWYKEIIKWDISIPVYQIHGGQTYKDEFLKQRVKLNPGLPRKQDVMHVLDCLEKMQKWLSHPSILLMGYTSFMTLTREDSNYAHRKYMAQLLKKCPGILILDEGHNPRSTKSRLRKGLMKVDTRLRILLSGTLFQNNFGEYFNTLCLARPVFVNEVLKELDPKYKKRNKERLKQCSLENRGRKLLITKISKKIDSNNGEERAHALKTLKKLTSKFIDVYEAGNSDKLPGLQCYTLMMKPTILQQEILLKLQNQRSVYRGFPLELELLITLGAIHPCLIKTTACSSQHLSSDELEDLEKFRFDVKSGSKVRFVMNLVPRCLMRNEKVLIFCHNIAPINLFVQLFERFYGWHKGREVLVLQGDIELFERGRVMEKFDEPGGPSKVLLASITACCEGISLTAASRVILLDSEWNPSKSKQAIARAFRPGQNKVVYVYQLLINGTLEEEKHGRTTWKEWVSDMICSDEHVEDPSHWQASKIEDELLREIVEEDRAALFHRIMKNEKASNVIRGKVALEFNFRWTRRNFSLVGIFGIAVPVLIYKGIIKEFHMQDEDAEGGHIGSFDYLQIMEMVITLKIKLCLHDLGIEKVPNERYE
ncbi:hypothetical protein DH2020_044252 [Rehmannia glutinosa]|uniref:SNF2 domain-containing protein CLASSY 1-like n=1 Tax=Rehmannia glutinosa TaxID=99300 RepID=A0ABR0UI93_REHGL